MDREKLKISKFVERITRGTPTGLDRFTKLEWKIEPRTELAYDALFFFGVN